MSSVLPSSTKIISYAGLQSRVDLARQRLDVFRFVADRNDDRQIRRSCGRLAVETIARHGEQRLHVARVPSAAPPAPRAQRPRHLSRRANGDDDARERPRQHELVPLEQRRAARGIRHGQDGRCDICESRMAPGLNTKRGPLGPSGVIDGEMPCFTNAS